MFFFLNCLFWLQNRRTHISRSHDLVYFPLERRSNIFLGWNSSWCWHIHTLHSGWFLDRLLISLLNCRRLKRRNLCVQSLHSLHRLSEILGIWPIHRVVYRYHAWSCFDHASKVWDIHTVTEVSEISCNIRSHNVVSLSMPFVNRRRALSCCSNRTVWNGVFLWLAWSWTITPNSYRRPWLGVWKIIGLRSFDDLSLRSCIILQVWRRDWNSFTLICYRLLLWSITNSTLRLRWINSHRFNRRNWRVARWFMAYYSRVISYSIIKGNRRNFISIFIIIFHWGATCDLNYHGSSFFWLSFWSRGCLWNLRRMSLWNCLCSHLRRFLRLLARLCGHCCFRYFRDIS